MREDIWARFAPAGPRIEQRRHSLRLAGYDYAQAGAYFVTICAEERACLFGDGGKEGLQCNEAGEMICGWWEECARKFPTVVLDEYVVMPNHFHGIVILDTEAATTAPTLGTIVGWFKAMTTNAYMRGVRDRNWVPFPARLWQRNYHDHIIRSERDLNAVRQYIRDNPHDWHTDPDNTP